MTLEGSDPVRLDGAPAAGAGWRDASGASPLADSMITDTVPEATTPLAIARALAPRIRERAAEIEATRQLPRELVLEIAGARLFRVALPEAEGGLGADVLTTLHAPWSAEECMQPLAKNQWPVTR